MTGIPLNIDWQQILLHLFNFTILFGALYILLYKPVKNFMASRESYYSEMDSRANEALDAAKEQERLYKDKVSGFDEEVKTEKARVRKDIDAMREREISAAKADAERIVANAKAEANREKEEIISSAQKEIAEMVTNAMEKLTLEQSASVAYDQFLDAAENESAK